MCNKPPRLNVAEGAGSSIHDGAGSHTTSSHRDCRMTLSFSRGFVRSNVVLGTVRGERRFKCRRQELDARLPTASNVLSQSVSSMLLPRVSFPKNTRTAMMTATLAAMTDIGREKLPPRCSAQLACRVEFGEAMTLPTW